MNRQTDNHYDRQAELRENEIRKAQENSKQRNKTKNRRMYWWSKHNIYELVTACLHNKYSTLNQIKKIISTQ